MESLRFPAHIRRWKAWILRHSKSCFDALGR
jgi:hypothetical protein